MTPAFKALRLKWWPVVVAVLILALVSVLGGFERRSDRFVAADLGAEMDAHDLVFAFSSGTLQHAKGTYSGDRWKLVANGVVFNPNDEGLAPITGEYGHFGFKDEESSQVSVAQTVVLGGDSDRNYVAPGRSPVSISVLAEFDSSYAPQKEVLFTVCQMEYTDNTVLGFGRGSARWNVDSTKPCYALHIPLTRLADIST